MAPGTRSKFGAPMFRTWGLGSKCIALRKVLVTLLGLFGVPRSDSAPRELLPLSPFVTPQPEVHVWFYTSYHLRHNNWECCNLHLLIDEKTHLPEASSVLARPVATGGGHSGAVLPQIFVPPKLFCVQKNCFKHIKTKVLPHTKNSFYLKPGYGPGAGYLLSSVACCEENEKNVATAWPLRKHSGI